jgi:hypothetical protein
LVAIDDLAQAFALSRSRVSRLTLHEWRERRSKQQGEGDQKYGTVFSLSFEIIEFSFRSWGQWP